MSLVNQLRHDLLTKARLSIPEVDALMAHPELAVEAAAPTPTQANLRDLLRQSAEASSLRMALGTFHRDLFGRPAVAEAATDEEPTTLVSDLDAPVLVTERTVSAEELASSLVDEPSGGGD